MVRGGGDGDGDARGSGKGMRVRGAVKSGGHFVATLARIHVINLLNRVATEPASAISANSVVYLFRYR